MPGYSLSPTRRFALTFSIAACYFLLLSFSAAAQEDRVPLYRVNTGGPEIAAIDGGIAWAEDMIFQPYEFAINLGSNTAIKFDINDLDPSVDPSSTPVRVFQTERFDFEGGSRLEYGFPVLDGLYEVRIYLANGFIGTSEPGERIFDISTEGTVPAAFQAIDPVALFGDKTGGVIIDSVEVTDGLLNLRFLHGPEENPMVNAIEILGLPGDPPVYFSPVLSRRGAVGETDTVVISARGGLPDEDFTYILSGQPPGIDLINQDSARIGGVIQAGADSGGPLSNGVYEVTLAAFKPSSDTVSTTFTWTVFPAGTDLTNFWEPVENNLNDHLPRYTNGFVQAGDKFYLFGGFENSRTLEVYDFGTRAWSRSAELPLPLNHFQAVEYGGYIWVLGAYENNAFPAASPATNIFVFNPVREEWGVGPFIPADRRRGSAAAVMHQGKFYLLGGNTLGDGDGSVPWFDEFDPATNSWVTLPDAPRARDHFQAAVINNKLYAVSGRQTGGTGGVFNPVIEEVDVYDFTTGSWSTLPDSANLPTARAGAAVVNFADQLYVIGGEIGQRPDGTEINAAQTVTEAFDPATNTWERKADLDSARHNTQAIVSGGGIVITAGSDTLGVGGQTNMEYFGEFDPQGEAIVPDVLGAPNIVFFSPGDTQTIDLAAVGGNQGIFILNMEIVGPDADDYSILSSQNYPLFISPDLGLSVEMLLAPDSAGTLAQLVLTLSNGQSEGIILNEGTPVPRPVHINAGGLSYTALDGTPYLTDQFFTIPSFTFSVSEEIENTKDDRLYQSERYGNFEYRIPVFNDTYTVDLHFAEIFAGTPGSGLSDPAGFRIFNVFLEGQQVLDNYDIGAENGALKAVIKRFEDIVVTDDTLNIRFEGILRSAKISAVGVIPNFNPGDRDGDGIPNDIDNCPDVPNPDQSFPRYWADLDGDGFGDSTLVDTVCDAPEGFFLASDLLSVSGDCNDMDSTINPLAEEIPNDLIDQNCDGKDSFAIVDQVVISGEIEESVLLLGVDTLFKLVFRVEAGMQPVNLADLHLSFDPSVLQIDGTEPGNALNEIVSPANVDNSAGTLQFTARKSSGTVQGTFDLLTVEFRVVGVDTTFLEFDQGDQPSLVALADSSVRAEAPPIRIITDATTSASEWVGEGRSLELFPNPSEGQLFLQIGGRSGERLQFQLVSANGQVMHHGQIQLIGEKEQFEFDLDAWGLPSGIYFLRLASKDFVYPVRPFLRK